MWELFLIWEIVSLTGALLSILAMKKWYYKDFE